MARTTNKSVAEATTSTTETMATAELKRANRVAIVATEIGFQAEFWKTHKKVATIQSQETGWLVNPNQNRSAQREDFRTWVTTHSTDLGIAWNPQDQRTDENKRLAKYHTDDDLGKDTLALIQGDITEFITKSPYEVTISDMTIDEITPVGISSKGTDLSKLGVIDGRYEKNGNWAWANIGICITLKVEDTEIYVSIESQLVSGQLKKPAHVGDGGWTQTAWNSTIKTAMIEAGILEAEEQK